MGFVGEESVWSYRGGLRWVQFGTKDLTTPLTYIFQAVLWPDAQHAMKRGKEEILVIDSVNVAARIITAASQNVVLREGERQGAVFWNTRDVIKYSGWSYGRWVVAWWTSSLLTNLNTNLWKICKSELLEKQPSSWAAKSCRRAEQSDFIPFQWESTE